jgi:hypothetical protein
MEINHFCSRFNVLGVDVFYELNVNINNMLSVFSPEIQFIDNN